MHKKLILFFFIISILIGCPVSETKDNANNSNSQMIEEKLTLKNSTIDFIHWNFDLSADNFVNAYATPRFKETTTFNTKVIENKYIKVTLLPEYGGRILSIIYKPTNQELLYQNPIGTPYGRGDKNFYYDWLIVYGGIFPTFSEAEHGKAWLLPWQYEELINTEEMVSIKMSFTDDISFTPSVGDAAAITNYFDKFDNGITGITCEATVNIYKERSNVDMNIKLINNQSSSVNYEYWTCTTLAPGSTPGNTYSPGNTELVVPITKIKPAWNPNNWIGAWGDTNVNFSKIDYYSDWTDMGIAYAVNLTKSWWGVINHDAGTGVLRIADNANVTKGLKFWTWGYNQGINANIENPADEKRAYIELWGGVSNEFFEDATLAANETKEWTESYIPTIGITKVTDANINGTVYLNAIQGASSIHFDAEIFSTLPNQQLQLKLQLNGNLIYTLADQTILTKSDDINDINIDKPAHEISTGSYDYELTLSTLEGEELIKTSIPVSF